MIEAFGIGAENSLRRQLELQANSRSFDSAACFASETCCFAQDDN